MERYLFLLQGVGLIHKTQYSNKVYYVATTGGGAYIHYGFGAGGKVMDRPRLSDFLKEKCQWLADPDRIKAFKAYNEKSGR